MSQYVIFKRILSSISLLLLIVVATSTPTLNAKDKILVAASTPTFKSIVEYIGGDRVEAFSIIPEGAEPHLFQFKPEIVEEISKAELLVLTGHFSFEKKILEVVNGRVHVLSLNSEGLYGGYKLLVLEIPGLGRNLHGYWLLPENGVLIASAIADALSRIDPEYSSYYRENLEHFIESVERISREYERVSVDLKFKGGEAVVSLPAEQYIAYALGLKVVGVISPGHGILPSASQLLKLQSILKASDNPVILTSETSLHYELKGYVEFLAFENANVRILKVKILSGGLGYLELLSYNLGASASLVAVESVGSNSVSVERPLIMLSLVLIILNLTQGVLIFKGRG